MVPFRAFQNLVGEHSVAGVPAKSVQDPFKLIWFAILPLVFAMYICVAGLEQCISMIKYVN